MRYVILSICLWFVGYTLFFFSTMGIPSTTSKWVHDVYTYKDSIAHNTTSPKIVISGGSSTLFGIDAQMIQKELGIPTINYGVNAGVMLPVILDKTKQILKPNDILIMPLEYDLYLYDSIPNAQMIDYITSYAPEIFYTLTTKEQFSIYWHIQTKSIIQKLTQPLKEPNDIYGVHNIDTNGNQINTNKSNQTQSQLNSVLSSKPYTYQVDINNIPQGIKDLKKFKIYCDSINVKIVFIPPPLLKHPIYYQNPFFQNIKEILLQNGFTYISDPYDNLYEYDSFFNTEYHLIDKVRTTHTAKLIKLFHQIN